MGPKKDEHCLEWQLPRGRLLTFPQAMQAGVERPLPLAKKNQEFRGLMSLTLSSLPTHPPSNLK